VTPIKTRTQDLQKYIIVAVPVKARLKIVDNALEGGSGDDNIRPAKSCQLFRIRILNQKCSRLSLELKFEK
jgi:hypothetical protein